jgi:hypothetical protein
MVPSLQKAKIYVTVLYNIHLLPGNTFRQRFRSFAILLNCVKPCKVTARYAKKAIEHKTKLSAESAYLVADRDIHDAAL